MIRYQLLFYIVMQSYVERGNEGMSQHEVDQYIGKMPDNIDKLIIPLNTSTSVIDAKNCGEHWHLLVCDVFKHQWEHYNYLDDSSELFQKCEADATKMSVYCQPLINEWLRQRNHAEILELKIENMAIPKQGTYPDSLLYTCYWIKRNCKPKPSKAKNIMEETVMIDIMQKWRVTLAVKILVLVEGEETSWNLDTNPDLLHKLSIEQELKSRKEDAKMKITATTPKVKK